MRRDPLALLDQEVDRPDQSPANRHRRARRNRARAGDAVIAISLFEVDLRDWNPQPLGGEPAIERAMPLSGCVYADRQQQFTGAGKADRCALPRLTTGYLQKARHTEAAPLAPSFGTFGPLPKVCDVGQIQGLLKQRPEIPAVEGGADRGFVGHRRGFDQVAPAQFKPVDAARPRRRIDEPLKAIIRLRPPGTAIRSG